MGCLFFLLFGCVQRTMNTMAHYPFDGDARDVSGHGNHGVVVDAVLTDDRFGNEKKAWFFDGEKSVITVAVKDMPSLESDLSISWWYYTESLPTFKETFDAANMMAFVDTSKKIGIQIGFRSPAYKSIGLDTWKWGGEMLLEVEQPSVAMWHHCVYTFDGETHRFYLDGTHVADSSNKAHRGKPTLLMFGNSPYGKRYFKGKLDDVRIYNRILEASDIDPLFNDSQ